MNSRRYTWLAILAGVLVLLGAGYFMAAPVEAPRDERVVRLYFYDQGRDRDAEGNIACSRSGLVAVERKIPYSKTPIEDTLRLELQGVLLADEIARGITTEFPLEGVALRSAILAEDGTRILIIDDPLNKTSGGACRAGILWFQLEATAMQFDGVSAARFEPEYLFQP